ncbi:hypothetical protein ACFXGR_45840 [Streptomyces mirabilis]|uniref:hypothetical protein n=1 Tax=Streptomyces mirabilis TaxID=68239 RepID=UPI00368D93E2
MTRQVGEALGLDTEVRGALEPLRGKPTKLADRGRLRSAAVGCGRLRSAAVGCGRLRKLPDGKFTARL